VPLHIEQATKLAQGRFVAELGDARDLSPPSSSADAVLLLGPLYHLPEAADRRAVLREARRLCRPGGQVIAAAISHWVGLFDLLGSGALDADQIRHWWSHVEETGGQQAGAAAGFTTAYFHRATELSQEFADAGVTAVEVVGIVRNRRPTTRSDRSNGRRWTAGDLA
jgi:SAM-dependent methyltransferase